VSHQIDLRGDGILGRDFFEAMQAHICYKERLLTFKYGGTTVRKKLGHPPWSNREDFPDMSLDRLILPPRAEVIVKLPVTEESPTKEGLVERTELLEGVYLAESLVRVDHGYVITSVLNTREQEVEIPTREVQVMVLEGDDREEIAEAGFTESCENGSRAERVIG
jgi:hypothetical protein